MPQEEQRFKRILVAVDGSDNSNRASATATQLAKKYQAELDVIHVIPRLSNYFSQLSMTRQAIRPTGFGQVYAEALKEAKKYIDEVVAEASAKGVAAKGEVLEDKHSIVEAIIDYAKGEKVDLIVTGTRGQGGFKKLLLGSVSSGVLSHAEFPVLVVK